MPREQFIQEQLNKRLGRSKPDSEAEQPTKQDESMYAIPAALRVCRQLAPTLQG